MTYRGQVKNGVVVLQSAEPLPEGAQVTVEVLPSPNTLGQDLMQFAGIVRGMPSDMAANHDHYAHGAPRRPPSDE